MNCFQDISWVTWCKASKQNKYFATGMAWHMSINIKKVFIIFTHSTNPLSISLALEVCIASKCLLTWMQWWSCYTELERLREPEAGMIIVASWLNILLPENKPVMQVQRFQSVFVFLNVYKVLLHHWNPTGLLIFLKLLTVKPSMM